MNSPSDDRIEFLIRDRLNQPRFLGLKLGETTPDRNAIRPFKEKSAQADPFGKFFEECGERLRAKGCESGGGRIADARIISVSRRRMRNEEKAGAMKGESATEIQSGKPEKARMRACVERAFARRAEPMEFSIGGAELAGAEGRVAMSNLCCDMRRLVFLERRMVAGRVCPESGNIPP